MMNNASVAFRFLLLTIALLFANYGLSQQKKFDRFMDSLTACGVDSMCINYDGSEFDSKGYQLKWVVITGTYGGSPYCCGGEVFEVKRGAEIPFSASRLGLYNKLNESFKKIGERYIILTTRYHEPRPTSNEHFVDVVYYYERVAD